MWTHDAMQRYFAAVSGFFSTPSMSRVMVTSSPHHRAGLYVVSPAVRHVPAKVTAFRDLVLELLHARPPGPPGV
jgi:hypothetical protein